MSALAHRLPSQPGRPALALLPSLPETRRPTAAVYRRRRLVAVLLASVLVIGVWTLATSGVSALRHRAVDPSVVAVSPEPIAAKTWTVGPGDTLWSIARAVQPQGDVRPLVDRLARAHGGTQLQVGETIPVP